MENNLNEAAQQDQASDILKSHLEKIVDIEESMTAAKIEYESIQKPSLFDYRKEARNKRARIKELKKFKESSFSAYENEVNSLRDYLDHNIVIILKGDFEEKNSYKIKVYGKTRGTNLKEHETSIFSAKELTQISNFYLTFYNSDRFTDPPNDSILPGKMSKKDSITFLRGEKGREYWLSGGEKEPAVLSLQSPTKDKHTTINPITQKEYHQILDDFKSLQSVSMNVKFYVPTFFFG